VRRGIERRTLRVRRSAAKLPLTTAETCVLMVTPASSIIPRSRTADTGCTAVLPIRTARLSTNVMNKDECTLSPKTSQLCLAATSTHTNDFDIFGRHVIDQVRNQKMLYFHLI